MNKEKFLLNVEDEIPSGLNRESLLAEIQDADDSTKRDLFQQIDNAKQIVSELKIQLKKFPESEYAKDNLRCATAQVLYCETAWKMCHTYLGNKAILEASENFN